MHQTNNKMVCSCFWFFYNLKREPAFDQIRAVDLMSFAVKKQTCLCCSHDITNVLMGLKILLDRVHADLPTHLYSKF